jgi:hypothetical protein
MHKLRKPHKETKHVVLQTVSNHTSIWCSHSGTRFKDKIGVISVDVILTHMTGALLIPTFSPHQQRRTQASCSHVTRQLHFTITLNVSNIINNWSSNLFLKKLKNGAIGYITTSIIKMSPGLFLYMCCEKDFWIYQHPIYSHLFWTDNVYKIFLTY